MGAGGMGAVYEVLHLTTERRRVLKTMLPMLLSDPDMRSRFKQEATITAGIESDHIVEVFDAGFDETQGLPFLVMEYLRGENLAGVLRAQGRLDAELVVTLLHQASLALERTHAAGIVHRDLKPENLFLTQRDDGSPRLKLLDFGIAKIVAQSANLNTTRSFGTPLYMSPEQVRGDGAIDGRADLYAVGQLAFTLLVGHAYWEQEAENTSGLYSLLLKVVEGASESATVRANRYGVALPLAFDEWFSQAIHRLPSGRFESGSELVERLSSALSLKRPRAAVQTAPLLRPAGEAQPSAAPSSNPSEAILVPTLAAVSDTPRRVSDASHSTGTATRNGRRLAWVLAAVVGGISLFLVSSWRGSALRTPEGSVRVEPSETPASVPLPTRAVLGSQGTDQGTKPQVVPAMQFAAVGGSASHRGTGSGTSSAAAKSGARQGNSNRVQPAKTSGKLGDDPSDYR